MNGEGLWLFMKNKYMPTSLCLYLNYFLHGMGLIILAQNMKFLTGQLHTDKAGISYVISAMGIGRLIALYISGVLSDKFGRKPIVYCGMAVYMAFFVGILFSPNVEVAFFFALLAGIANSIMDSGTYPALMEAYPKAPGTANVLIKAFVSGGQFLLPFIMAFIINNNLYYGISFIIPVVIFLLIGLFMARLPFPQPTSRDESEWAEVQNKYISKPNMWVEGLCLILIGFTSTATFTVIQVWLPTYGQEVIGIAQTDALKLISYYSIGSIVSVFFTAYLVKSLVRPVTIVFVYPLISFLSLLLLLMVRTPAIATLAAIALGFSAAGGVLQLALTVMVEFFPEKKGTITGIVYTASCIAAMACPAITGVIQKTSVPNIMVFDAVVTLIGVLLAVVVNIRYRKVMNMEIKGVSV